MPEKRTVPAAIRLSPFERDEIQNAADAHGVSFSEFVRVAALAFARREPRSIQTSTEAGDAVGCG